MSDKTYIFLAILAALVVAGVVGVVAYTGTKSAEREQEQIITCLNQGGTWMDDWNACIYGPEAK